MYSKNEGRMNVIGLVSVYDLLGLIDILDVEFIVDCGKVGKGDDVKIYPAIKPISYKLLNGSDIHVSFGIDYGYEERCTDLVYPRRVIPFFSVKHKWDEKKNEAKVSCLSLYIRNMRRLTIRISDNSKYGIKHSTVLKPCRDFPLDVWVQFIDLYRDAIIRKLKKDKWLMPVSEYEDIAFNRWWAYDDEVVFDDADVRSYVKKLGSNKPSCMGWLD